MKQDHVNSGAIRVSHFHIRKRRRVGHIQMWMRLVRVHRCGDEVEIHNQVRQYNCPNYCGEKKSSA